MTEWRPVVGHEGRYEVSDDGQVRSLDRLVGRKRLRGKPMCPNRAGQVHLSANGHEEVVYVYALMMAAFVGPRPAGQWIRHWDDDRTHNVLSNLRYGTPSDNREDAIRNGRDYHVNLTTCNRRHRLEDPNLTGSRGKSGRRRYCLACNRARAYVHVHPELDVQAVADRYYAAIMFHSKGCSR